MNKTRHIKSNRKGFTLIELLVAMAISGIVAGAIFTAFQSQQKSYFVQDQVAEMQQNLRAAMDIVVREVRMAGFDPTNMANAGIITATASRLNFSMDITDNTGNGSSDGDTDDTDELIDFGFKPDDDADDNGIADSGAASLGRQTGGAGGYQPVAENIQAIEFNYVLSDGTRTLTPSPALLNSIRAVEISILARSAKRDKDFTNAATYTAGAGTIWGPFNDNYRRRLIITNVQCRNMGLYQQVI